jgi:NADH pyrophosphatase NudC (nudix superfamily)
MTDNELKEHCLQEAGIDLGRYSYNELNVIKDALRRYHNAKLKLLSIADVVGRSEQLPCGECENYAQWDNGIRWCSICGTKLS